MWEGKDSWHNHKGGCCKAQLSMFVYIYGDQLAKLCLSFQDITRRLANRIRANLVLGHDEDIGRSRQFRRAVALAKTWPELLSSSGPGFVG